MKLEELRTIIITTSLLPQPCYPSQMIPFKYMLLGASLIARSIAFSFPSIGTTSQQLNTIHLTTSASVREQQPHQQYKHRSWRLHANENKKNSDEIKSNDLITQTSWYAAEALGKIFGSFNTNTKDNKENNAKTDTVIDLTLKPSSINETIKRIKLDNDRFYFLSGKVDSLSYDPQCYFADPFVGFKGTDRFVENLQNLGSFITTYRVKVLNYEVSDDQLTVNTKLMVKLELNLPWRPILAWPWGVKYQIDPETFLIVSHIESWDIEPFEGVKQVFRKPTLEI